MTRFWNMSHSQKIGKPNNFVGRKKPNVPKGDSQKSVKVTCVWERRTLVLVISKLFKNCKFYLINHVSTKFSRNIENAIVLNICFYCCTLIRRFIICLVYSFIFQWSNTHVRMIVDETCLTWVDTLYSCHLLETIVIFVSCDCVV